jgi:two-component system OmpR family sensor kinase
VFRTLRWRLTLWYGAVALALLTLFSLVPVTLLVSSPSVVVPEQTRTLLSAANGTASVLEVTRDARLAVGAVQEPDVWVIVRDADGAELASTPGAEELPELDGEAAGYPEVQRAGAYLATRAELASLPGVTVEAYAGPMGATTFRNNPVLGRLIPLQAVGLVAALVAMVALGPTVAAGALRPLRRVIAVAEDLRRGNLESRVDLPELKERRDEVGEVAASFDAMAESLEKLFEAERESKEGMRRFVADASHELRTPLTSVLGYLDVLEEGGERDPAIRNRAHAAMRNEGGRMVRLVEDLLTLARLESRGETPVEPVDLATIARDTAESHPKRRIKVSAPEPVVLTADPDSVKRMVSNLLSNAVKHTPSEGEIEVSVKHLEGEAILRVSDEGTGISKGDLPHIFERFYRAGGSRAGEGTGLGLTIVKETVESFGGRIEAESAPGAGSVFTVRLPLSGSLPGSRSGS